MVFNGILAPVGRLSPVRSTYTFRRIVGGAPRVRCYSVPYFHSIPHFSGGLSVVPSPVRSTYVLVCAATLLVSMYWVTPRSILFQPASPGLERVYDRAA